MTLLRRIGPVLTGRAPFGRALLGVSLLAATLSSCATNHTTDEPYGVVAAPPFPVEVPVTPLNPDVAIADVDGTVVVDAAGGTLSFRGEAGVVLESVNATEGGELRAVSADGLQAALFKQIDEETSLITVIDRRAAHGVTGSEVERREFTLDGVVEPEAFSTDGELLYVIDHQGAGVPGAYRVRPFNMTTGELETIVGPTKVPLLEDMSGTGRRQVWSPDGSRLNTLYIRQTHHHHDTSGSTDDVHTHGEPGTDGFVHVLDLDGEWAHCLDLPAEFGNGDLATTSLAVSPDGQTVAVADLTAGQIAFASASDLSVTRVIPLPEFEVGAALHLGLTNDALILGSGTAAQWFHLETMESLGDPITFGHDLVAFTSPGSTVLAWIDGITSGPAVLGQPAIA